MSLFFLDSSLSLTTLTAMFFVFDLDGIPVSLSLHLMMYSLSIEAFLGAIRKIEAYSSNCIKDDTDLRSQELVQVDAGSLSLHLERGTFI